MRLPGFVGPSYQMDALQFDCQRTVNYYPLISETQTSKSGGALRSIPGYTLFSTAGGGSIRGMKTTTSNGRGWVVSGYELYEVNTNGTSTLRGTLLTGSGRVGMAENGTQLMVVDGTYGYIYNMNTDVFAQITDSDFPMCNNVDFQDGYFLVTQKNTPNFYISDLYDGLVWDPLDFARADTSPDNLVGLISDHGNVWLFGTSSVEIWQNTGALAFPFANIPGAVVQTGCAAWATICKFDNTLIWLGFDQQGRGIVWKANGYSAQRVSTQAIESKIADVTDLTNAYAYVYHEQGHIFYCLQLGGLDSTLVFDGATSSWHERSYYDTTLDQMQPHRGSGQMFFNGMNLIGDDRSGAIYEQDLGIFTFNSEYMYRDRIYPHLQEEKAVIPYHSVEIDMQVGVGLNSGQGSDPMMMMRYSDDGGMTWSYWRTAPVGKIGKYKNRARFARCGSARDRVFHFRYTEPTFAQLNDCYINAT